MLSTERKNKNYLKILTKEQKEKFNEDKLQETTSFLKYANIIGLLTILLFGVYDLFAIEEQATIIEISILKCITALLIILFTIYYFKSNTKKVSYFTHILNISVFTFFLLAETILMSSYPQQIFHIMAGLAALNLATLLVFNLSGVVAVVFTLITLIAFNINFFNLKELSATNAGYIDVNIWFLLATSASIIIRRHIRNIKARTFLVNIHLKEAHLQKYKLFGIVSHDLKNMMSSLTGLTSFLKSSKDSVDAGMMDKMLDAIHDSSSDALSIFEELMIWLRSQMNAISPNINDINIDSFLNNLLNQMSPIAENKGISIEINNSTLNSIKSDANILSLVLRNLISNAVKFSNEGAKIEVNTYNSVNDTYIEVRDYGVGIPKEKIIELTKGENISSTFGTNGEKGTGLGLNLSHTLISHINGNIKISSIEGVGTSVKIHLKTL